MELPLAAGAAPNVELEELEELEGAEEAEEAEEAEGLEALGGGPSSQSTADADADAPATVGAGGPVGGPPPRLLSWTGRRAARGCVVHRTPLQA